VTDDMTRNATADGLELVPDDAHNVAPSGEVERAVAFYLGGQRYALPLERVNEIQQIVAFSEVPEDSSAVVGMINMRGRVIPAVDMRRLVGLEGEAYTLETPMIITQTQGQTVALIVDSVEDVLELPAGCLQEAPPLHALASKMIGVCRMPDGLMNLLDIDLLLSPDMLAGGG
jgi:purine-binding chemotaxis protein CheW